MASGRIRQLRIHAVGQAQLVWEFMRETSGDALQRYIESGVLAGGKEKMPANPLADKIAAEITANDGRLVVDPTKFRQMREELKHGQQR